MQTASRALPALLTCAAAACSAAGTNLDKLGESRRSSTTAEDAPALPAAQQQKHTPAHSGATETGSAATVPGTIVEGGHDSGPTLPTDVAGSFLVLCSADTQVSYLAAPTAADDTVACVLADDAGAPVVGTNHAVKLRTPQGELVDVATLPKETSAPWGFGFRLPAGAAGEAVVSFELGGRTETASTSRFDFRWLESALFGAFLKGQLDDLVIPASVLGGRNTTTPPNVPGTPGIPGTPVTHSQSVVAFVTAAEFDGKMTVEAADLDCTTRGMKLHGKASRWQAALTTEATPLAARFDDLSVGPVTNLEGKTVAASLDALLGAPLGTAVLYDDRGLPVTAPLNAPPYDVVPPRYNAAVWSPLVSGCDDWTSAAAGSLAFVADVTKTASGWSRAGQRSCARKARVLCVGFP